MILEKSFPRGGVPAKESKQNADKNDKIIFGAVEKKIKKSKPSKTTDETDALPIQGKDDIIETHSAELLNYDTVQDGMNIMGIVTAVDQLYVTISLPGRMRARISALEISDAYTKAAREFLKNAEQTTSYKTLQELYKVGQLVYARVQEVKQNKFGHTELVMSLKPSEVHADLVHTMIRKGFTFNGAIEEIQEHGFIIESGIKGLRTFLPQEKSQKELFVGQLVHLKVEKITTDRTASTCICKQVQPDQLKIKSIQSEANIDYILPSTIVSFQVTKCLKDGLQGSIMDEAFTAYVNEHQLGEPLMLPEDYDINGKYDARILYVMPLTKLVYLTLNLRKTQLPESESNVQVFKRGDIVENAKVHHLGTGGIVLVLNNNFKGLISYKTIKANYQGNYDQDEVLNKYAKKTKHKVRVLDYDLMDSIYMCSDDAKVVNEKVFGLKDLKAGEIVTAVINNQNSKIGGYDASVGKVKAKIEHLFLASSTKQYEPNTKIRCRVLYVDDERKTAYLTNRAEYLNKNSNLLTNIEDAKKNKVFIGTIVKNTATFYLVKFLNGITGLLEKKTLSNFLSSEHIGNFSEGQTMPFRILSNIDNRIVLSLVEEICELGQICEAKVSHVLETGLEISVRHETALDEFSESKALVPVRLLSDFMELLHAKSRICAAGSELKVVCLHKNIFSVRDVAYFEENGVKTYQNVQPGDILRAYVENVNEDVIELFIPIHGYGKLVKVHLNMLLMNAYQKSNVVLHPEQVIFIKVLGKEDVTKSITVSAKLTDVWDKQLKSTSVYIERFFEEIEDIREALKKKKMSIAQFSIGDKIEVIFEGIDSDTQDWLFKDTKNKIVAVAKASNMAGLKNKLPKVGTKQQSVILWIDYSSEILIISPKPVDIKHIKKTMELPEELSTAQNVNAKVLLKLENILVCSLKKGPNPLVFCPTSVHYNDFEKSASADVKEGDFCKLAFIHRTKPFAVQQKTWDLWQHLTNHQKLKRTAKQSESVKEEEPKNKKSKIGKKDEKEMTKHKKKNEINESEAPKLKKPKLLSIVEKPTVSTETPLPTTPLFFEDRTPTISRQTSLTKKSLSGVTDFWSTDILHLDTSKNEESSDDDEENTANATDAAKQKKRKLNAVEKFKQQREEESRLREIEEKYADPHHMPESVDQFDRLVLSDPNNSKNWINYMVFHLQSAEIDKARAIAQRAIKAITSRNVDDHLNIWIALLNLEIRYGIRETFDNALKEALTYNEPLKVYLRVIEILRETKKNQELIEIVNVITKKFKTVPDVWKVAADAYFAVGMTEQAQQLLHKSLASLPEREHVNTIVSFANLNHRHGCNEMAQTLLDQIVTSYPKRVDVWTQYVDMLVKDQLIESARNVLDRAILQKIPLKKMRTMFKKYLDFEEKHGTENDVEKVKRLAAEYVKNNANL